MILHLPNQSHKCVESIEEIPKLKFSVGCDDSTWKQFQGTV